MRFLFLSFFVSAACAVQNASSPLPERFSRTQSVQEEVTSTIGTENPFREEFLNRRVKNRDVAKKKFGFDYADMYKAFLDKVIDQLDIWIDELNQPSKETLDNIACASSFNSFIKHITSSWAISMIDASSKLQSGLLSGNLYDLGMYDQCVESSAEMDKEDPHTIQFSGQHCLVSFNIQVPNGTITMNGEETKLKDLVGQDSLPISISQCFPSRCKRQTLENAINSILSVPDDALQLFGIQYGVNVTLDQYSCHVKDQDDIDVLDWVLAAIFFVFLFICAFCTTVDFFYVSNITNTKQANLNQTLIQAFSAYTNGGKLLDTRTAPDAMTSLNGLRVFSICWVVLGHRYRFVINQYLVDLLDFPKEFKKWAKMILFSGPLSVDSFFLISGLLNMYIFCLQRERTRRYTPLETLIGYIHRFLRLTPSYLVMIGFTASWMYRMGDGPNWDKIVGSARDSCRKYWWQNIIYLNNYLNPDDYCMMQSWYLSADMQMFWLSPFVVYPLWRWPLFGFIEVFLLTLASILAPMFISYFYEVRAPIPVTTDVEESSKVMRLIYLPTHTKTISYVIGILAGYIVYLMKREKIKFEPGIVTLAFFWTISFAMMLYAIFGGYTLYQTDMEYHQVYSAFYIGTYRFFWVLGLVWIVIACVTGYGGPINTILSWPALGPIAKLTYCIYLTHIAVIHRSVGAQRVPIYFSDYNMVELYIGDLVMSIGTACVLSLMFEAPIMRLEKLIFGGDLKRRPVPRAPPAEASHNHAA